MVAEIASGLAVLYLVKMLVDTVSGFPPVSKGTVLDVTPLLRVVLLTAACTLAFLAARAVSAVAREAQGLQLADYVNGKIQEQSMRVDLAFFESARYFDTLQRARAAGSQRPSQVAANILMLGKNCLMLAGVAALLGTISWLVLVLLAIVLVPALMIRLHFTRSLYDWRHRRTQMDRQSRYLDWLMTSDVHAKEVRLGVLENFLRSRYIRLRGIIRGEQMDISRRRAVFETLGAAVGTVVFAGTLAHLAFEATQGRSSVGDLALFFVVFQRAQAMGQEMVQQTSQLYEDNLYMGLLFEYLDIKPVLNEPASPTPIPKREPVELRFESVGFGYPGTAREVLKNIDLVIPPGSIIALVGANGSGKTSLIKLLCRLYDPTQGRLTLNGRDVRDFALEDYRGVCSVIFQDFARYADTASENIRFGDIRLPEDSPRILQAAIAAEADGFIRALSDGYDTPLTRTFDGGEELSQGQWQRIALARAFVAGSRVVVLDEPTSALDPGVEFDLFRDFRTLIGDRSALVISHRLSTIRQADFIYVLEEGRICEAGRHEELMERQGVYAKLFQKQAYFYRDSDSPDPMAEPF